MILTDEERREIVNNFQLNVGDWNCNGLSVANAIETAVLAKLADVLKDSDRLDWILHHAYVSECFTDHGTVLEIAGTDRQVPRPDNWRQVPYPILNAIDAAMLASKAVRP